MEDVLWYYLTEYYIIILSLLSLILCIPVIKSGWFCWSITSVMLERRSDDTPLPDAAIDLDVLSLDDSQIKDLHDELSFICVSTTDRSYIHVEITRKTDRISNLKFTLTVDDEYTYTIPGGEIRYNSAANRFSVAGLSLSPIEEGRKWRISYTGPLTKRMRGCVDTQETVKLLFLWNMHSPLIDTMHGKQTQSNIQDYLMMLYKSGDISTSDIYNLANQPQTQDQTSVQLGGMHGFIQVIGGNERRMKFSGVKRHSYSEMTDSNISVSSLEQILVSKKGHFSYIRLPKPHWKNGKPVIDQSALSKVCFLKMYPNCEMVDGNLHLALPFINGWSVNHTDHDELNNQDDDTVIHIEGEGPPAALYTVSQSPTVECVLLSTTFTQRHPGLTQDDGGIGLILYSNVWLEPGENNSHSVRETLMKEITLQTDTATSVPLLSVDNTECDCTDVVLSLDRPECKNSRIVGGKGSQLAVLYQSNISECTVPMAVCVTIRAFDLQLERNGTLRGLANKLENETHADHESVKRMCEAIRSEFITSDIAEETCSALRDALTTFPPDTRLAVRSSAIGEDGEDLSAAGQMDTILGVKGYETIIKAVKQCWASHFTFLAVQYKRNHGQMINSGMGVVIQQMVSAEKAGVIFTYDPLNSDSGTMVINSNFGIGESVVSGQAEPDTFHVTRRTLSLDPWEDKSDCIFTIRDRHIGSKAIQHLVSESGDVIATDTSRSQGENLCSQSSIDDSMILRLCEISLQLEQAFGFPCDIEWAVYKDQIYLLQSRPITTLDQETEYELLHEFDSPLTTQDEMLSTMNVGEVIPGAVTPLTQSCIIDKLEYAMQCHLRDSADTGVIPGMHLPIKSYCNTVLMSVHGVEAPHKGRNLVSDRKTLELALAGHMIDGMTDEDVLSFHPTLPFYRRISNSTSIIKFLWGAFENMMEKMKEVDSLVEPDTDDCLRLYDYIDDALRALKEVFAADIPAAGESGVYSQFMMGVLTKGSKVWESKHLSDIASLLGCRLTHVFSAGVPERLEELAVMIKHDPNIGGNFAELSPSEAVNLLRFGDVSDGVRSAYTEFIKLHGHRNVKEMELIEKCWAQNPSDLVETLQMMVASSDTEHATQSTQSTVDEVISNLQSDLSSGAKRFIKYLLPRTKRAINNREVAKSQLIMSICKVKLAYWRMGELMFKQGFLPSEQLVFFCTHSEVKQILVTRNGRIISKAKKRQRIYEKQKELKFPRFSRGMPEPLITGRAASYDVDVELRGMPVSVGEVTGTARVVVNLRDAHTIQKNDIMIVPYTDVGWAPFFPLVSGVVTEQGGLVSHGAVVAREYGIPCVASCHNATNVFQSGDIVCLNGSAGTIKRIKHV